MGRIVQASIVFFALPVLVNAQSHAGGFAAAHTAVSASHPTMASAPRATVRGSMPAHAVVARAGRTTSPVTRSGRPVRRPSGVFSSGPVNFQDVPGLGFDFPHLAATSGNRRNHGSRFNGAFPFGFDGFLLGPSVIVEEPPAGEQQAIAQEETPVEAANADPVERHSRSRTRAAASEDSLAPPALQADAEQYVFVRRDGGLVFAVAYSWDNGSLRYITPEGFRRTMTPDALDLTATRQFNEQRGLTFRSPA